MGFTNARKLAQLDMDLGSGSPSYTPTVSTTTCTYQPTRADLS